MGVFQLTFNVKSYILSDPNVKWRVILNINFKIMTENFFVK